MKSDESADGPTSDILNSGPELPLLSQGQCPFDLPTVAQNSCVS